MRETSLNLLSSFFGNAGAGAAVALLDPSGVGAAGLLLGYVLTGVVSGDADETREKRTDRKLDSLKRWLRLNLAEQRELKERVERELDLDREGRARLDEVFDFLTDVRTGQQNTEELLHSMSRHQMALGHVTAEAAELSKSQLEEVLKHLRALEEGTPEFNEKEIRGKLREAREAFDRSDFWSAEELCDSAFETAKLTDVTELKRDALRLRIVSSMNASLATPRRREHPTGQWLQDLDQLEDLEGDESDIAVLRARVSLLARDHDTLKEHMETARRLASPGSARAVEVAILGLQACRPDYGGDGLVSLLLEQKHIDELLQTAKNDQKALLLVSLIAARVDLEVPLEDATELLSAAASEVVGEDRAVVLLELRNLTRFLLSRKLWGDATQVARAGRDLGQRTENHLQAAEAADLLAYVLSEHARQVKEHDHCMEEAVAVRRATMEELLDREGCEPEKLTGQSLQAYIPLLANCLRDEVHLASRHPSADVAETWERLDEDCQKGIAAFSEGKRTMKGDVGAVESVLVCLQGDIAAGQGRYADAARFFARGSAVAQAAHVMEPGVRFRAASDAAYFSGVGGDFEAAEAFINEAAEFAKTAEQQADLKNHRGMLEDIRRIASWVESADAQALADVAKRKGVREGLRPTIARVVQHWDDANGPCPVLYDYWGRGGFQRLAAAVRGVPDDVIAVDATTVEEIERAVQLLCPLFETVIVKWKGPLASGIAGANVRNHRDEEAGWLCGAGYVNCANTSADMYGIVGTMSSVPPDVVEWLGGRARRLFEAGRVVVAPAVHLGCVQTAFGWTDDALLARFLKGVVVGLGGKTTPTTSTPTIDLASVALPYVGGRDLSMDDLGRALDDLGDTVTPFRRRMLAVLGEQETTPYGWSQRKALRLEIEDAVSQIRRQVQAVVKNTSLDCSETPLNVNAAERQAWVGKVERAEILHGISGDGDSALRAWLPLWMLGELGGSFDWGAPPSLGAGSARGVMSSWLSPPTIGAGVAGSRRVTE